MGQGRLASIRRRRLLARLPRRGERWRRGVHLGVGMVAHTAEGCLGGQSGLCPSESDFVLASGFIQLPEVVVAEAIEGLPPGPNKQKVLLLWWCRTTRVTEKSGMISFGRFRQRTFQCYI